MAGIDRQIKEFKKKLERFGADVLPRVVAETVNTVAGFAHVASVKNVRDRFVNRNKYTERSIRYYKANPKKDWRKIKAVSGSISDYMDEQEAGGYRTGKKGGNAMEVTKAARGGNPASVVKRRFVLVGSKMPKEGIGPKQFVGVPRGYGKRGIRPYGLYARNKKNKYLVMIRNISSAKIKIEPKHWHTDAVNARYKKSAVLEEFVRQARMELSRLEKK